MDYLSQILNRLKDSVKSNAKKNNTDIKNVAVLIYNEAHDMKNIEPLYGIMVNKQIVKKMSFNQVMDITFDPLQFLGGSKKLSTPYIIKFLQRKCHEHNIPPSQVRVHISSNDNGETLQAFLYQSDVLIKEMKLEEIMSD